MNEEALLYSFKLFANDGYEGSFEDYKKLIASDSQALDHSYSLFKNDGYEGSIEDFSGLVIEGKSKDPVEETVDMGSESQAVNGVYNLEDGSLAYNEEDLYKDRKKRIKEIEAGRAKQERLATTYAYENYEGDEAAAYVQKALQDYDDQYKKELDLIRVRETPNGDFDTQERAIQQLKKDTGATSMAGEPADDWFNYGRTALRMVGGIAADETPGEVIELNEDLEAAVVAGLSKRELQKLADGYYTLEEKEELINKYKAPAIEKALGDLNREWENTQELARVKSTELNARSIEINAALNRIKNSTTDGNYTQEDIDEYNALIEEYKLIEVEAEKFKNQFDIQAKQLSDKQANIEGVYGIDLATGLFKNNFQLSNDIEKFRETYAGDGFWNGTADIVGGEIVQGLFGLTMQSTVGVLGWIAGAGGDLVAETLGLVDEEEYSVYDAMFDAYSNFAGYELFPKSIDEKFRITKEEGGLADFNLRSYLKLTASMIPFTAMLVSEVKKGKVGTIGTKVGNYFQRLGRKGQVLSPLSLSLKNDIIMAEAAFKATIVNNYKDAQKSGLSDSQAFAYATTVSLTEGLVQSIMPDANFLKGIAGKAIKDNFVGTLKGVATREGIKAAGKSFATNIAKEIGEEELTEFAKLFTDVSYGLALPKGSEFLNNQIELIAGTVMLSGGMGAVGSYQTFRNQKQLIYNQIRDNIVSTDLYLKTLQEGLDPESLEYKQIAEARQFALDVYKATQTSPQNVTAEQIDLIMQKGKLVEQKSNVDSAFHSDIDAQIKAIDEQIQQSDVKGAIAKAFEKDIENIGKSMKSAGVDVDQTIIFEGDEAGTSNQKQKEFLMKEAGYTEEQAEAMSNSPGLFVTVNGKEVLIVNKDSALEDSTVTTGQHEFLHKVLKAALSKDPALAQRAAQALFKELENMVGGKEKLLNTNWYRRYAKYLRKVQSGEYTAEMFYEEALPLFSEALTNGDIKYNADALTRIGNLIRQILQDLGLRQISFETGQDVVNFIVDYNKAYQKGKFRGALKTFAQKGEGKGIGIKTDAEAKSAAEQVRDQLNKTKVKESVKADLNAKLTALEDQVMSGEIDYETYEQKLRDLENQVEQIEIKEEKEKAKPKAKAKKKSGEKEETLTEASNRSKKILDRIGNDPKGYDPNNPKIYEVLDGLIRSKSKAFKTTGGNVVNLNKLPDFEMENMVQETLAQLIPMIKNFDPKRNDSLYGYINSQLANKMKQALKSGKVTTQQFTSDVTEMKGIAAEETATETQEKPKYTKLMDADVFGVDVINSISNKLVSTLRVLRSRLTAAVGKNQNTSPLIAEILANISTQADIDIKAAMGGKADGVLRNWLLKNKKAIIENLTTTFLMGKTQKDGVTVLGGLPIAIQKKVNGEWLSYPNWVGKKIDRETTQKRGATAGNEIVRRVPANRISDADYLDFFLEPTGNPIRGRKEALAKALAGEIGLELFVEGIQSETGPIFEAFEKNQEILGEVLKDNYLGEINKQVERGTVKFSLKQTKDALSDLIDRGAFDGNVDTYLRDGLIKLNSLDENASVESIINTLLPEFDKKIIALADQRRLNTKIIAELLRNKVFEYTEIPPAILDIVEEFIYQQKEIAAELAFQELEANINKAKDKDKGLMLIEFVTLYSRAIRGSKILGITNNQKLYDRLVDIAGEELVGKTFDIKTVASGKTLVYKGTTTPVTPFTSTPILKAQAEQSLSDPDFKFEWQAISDKTKDEAFIAQQLVISFIKELKKNKSNSYIKKQLLLLNGDQSSIIRKLSYWKGVEESLIGKSGIETVVEHADEAGTIFKAIIDFVDNGNLRSLNKTFANATINLISKKSDKALRDTGKKDKQRYTDANISLFEALDSASDKNISETIAAGHTTNAVTKASLAADPEYLSNEFNKMLERKTGMKASEKISKARAKQLGKGKGRFDLFLPPNAEDFQGLLYKFLGEGKQGDADFAFFKEFLLDPFDVAENAMSSFRQRLAESLKKLQKELGDIDKDIDAETIKKIEATGFTPDQAVRIFIWNRMGRDIPNLTAKEKASLLSIVRRDPSLMRYAKELMRITEQFGGYPPPSDSWYAGNTKSDLYQYANENVRAKYLENWQANADAIFNADNLIKLEALYGKDFVKNLKEVLRRMKSGSNRPLNLDDSASAMLDYINGSVGTIMFLNIRSAVLQTISSVNFLNWHDNNLFAAGKTLLDLPNFIKTFMEVMNSDFLKQRRDGLQINVSEAEIASAVEQSKNKAKALFSALIKFGYKPTQFADSFAIAIGGTPFLINRTNTYIKSGLDPKTAREKAFTDFRAIAEENQQSSRTDRTSNIQASTQGRLLFAFNNTPFQMTRILKKAILDLANGRGDIKTNISKIIYYGAIQNILFYTLQQASMALLFGADDDEEENKNLTEEQLAKKQADRKNKESRLLNSVLDGLLRGSGLPGAILSTVKNVIMEYYKQEAKGDWKADHGETIIQALNFSPPLGSKASRIYKGLKGRKFEETTFDAIRNKSKIAAAITNVPVDRLVTKIDNMRVAVNEPIEDWKRLALIAGWDQWSLGVYDDLDAIEEASGTSNKGKTRSQIMKEVWDKRKAEDKKQRIDNIRSLKGKGKVNF